MKADGKKTLMYECGYTDDIVNGIKEVFDKTFSQCYDICKTFESGSIQQTCRLISDFVCSNIKYKADISGEQWIKTPARLLSDGVGDCKSYSILICSILTCLGIDNCFRFAAYNDYSDFTHVYPVAFGNDGKEYVVDCVAIQQMKADLFGEVKYFKKKDIMNSTRISCLSGFEDEKVIFSKNDSIPVITAKCFKFASLADEAMRNTADFLLWIVDNFTEKRELEVCAKVFAMYFDGVAGLDRMKQMCKAYVAAGDNPNSPYQISESVKSKELSIVEWFNQNITNYAGVCIGVNVTDTINEIIRLSVVGLYLMSEDKYLNKTQRIKKENEKIFFQTLCENTGITIGACKLVIYGSIVWQYGMTPTQLLKKLFPKQDFGYSYSALIAGCGIGEIIYEGQKVTSYDEFGNLTSGNSNSKSFDTSGWSKMISSLGEAVSKIVGSFKGGYVTNIAPYQGDSSSIGFDFWSLLPFVGVGVVAIMVLKKKKK